MSVVTGGSRWSLWSDSSILSIASKGSVLSVGSAGSLLSIGSAGSVASILSIGCAGCIGSGLSAFSRWSLLSSRSVLGIMAKEATADG